jgi:hypothetical protein
MRQPRIKLINRFGNTIPTRVPKEANKNLLDALIIRRSNGLSTSLKVTEGWRLLLRTNGWKQSLEEIKKRPRREDSGI